MRPGRHICHHFVAKLAKGGGVYKTLLPMSNRVNPNHHGISKFKGPIKLVQNFGYVVGLKIQELFCPQNISKKN